MAGSRMLISIAVAGSMRSAARMANVQRWCISMTRKNPLTASPVAAIRYLGKSPTRLPRCPPRSRHPETQRLLHTIPLIVVAGADQFEHCNLTNFVHGHGVIMKETIAALTTDRITRNMKICLDEVAISLATRISSICALVYACKCFQRRIWLATACSS